ncbi:MAG: rRNA maturation RNAse YbeY [Candidatus Pacebacteria bacterium]|nr:rRNA maturation RNAse YbeY [Candidatus Paceibacterota bacterium]
MLNLVNLTKKRRPALPWEKIKDMVLGKKYSLSVILAENKLMSKFNRVYRNKKTPADTLSFIINKGYGEIFLNSKNTHKKALSLFVHSLLHLKGMEHGEKMEKTEQKYFKKICEELK